MLLSAVFTLHTQQAATLPVDQGRAVHGLFLDWLRKADPKLAQQMHDAEGPKPFTISSLRGARVEHDQITLLPDQSCWFRITTFSPELSTALAAQILPNPPEQVTLSDVPFRLAGATTDGSEHPWAGQSDYSQMAQEIMLTPQEPSPWLNLRFASPTAFHSQKQHLPLPLPRLAVESWLKKWNAFAPLRLHEEANRFAEECLAISRYRLETQAVRFGPATIVGFVGHCTYRFLNRDRYWTRAVHLLAAFSFYCGTGHKTTMGLGQSKVIRHPSSAHSSQSREKD